MARFRNTSKSPLSLFRLSGRDAHLVKPGESVTVQGEVSSDAGDAYIVGTRDHARAYPKSTWELVTESPERKPKQQKDGD